MRRCRRHPHRAAIAARRRRNAGNGYKQADADLRRREPATIARRFASLAGKYDAVNIKLDKSGGLTQALALATEAERRGSVIMVGCMVATSLAMAPAMLLAPRARVRRSRWSAFAHPRPRRGAALRRKPHISAASCAVGMSGNELRTWPPIADPICGCRGCGIQLIPLESSMAKNPRPSEASRESPRDPQYDAIYAEIVSTHHGRRFLAEYARRHDCTAPQSLVGTIARIEFVVPQPSADTGAGLIDSQPARPGGGDRAAGGGGATRRAAEGRLKPRRFCMRHWIRHAGNQCRNRGQQCFNGAQHAWSRVGARRQTPRRPHGCAVDCDRDAGTRRRQVTTRSARCQSGEQKPTLGPLKAWRSATPSTARDVERRRAHRAVQLAPICLLHLLRFARIGA